MQADSQVGLLAGFSAQPCSELRIHFDIAWACDAKIGQIVEGTNQIQRMIIAREFLKKFAQ